MILVIFNITKKTMNKQSKHYKFLMLAKDNCKYSDYKQFKIGSLLVYKNKIISSGYNFLKTHPMQKKYNKFRFSSDSNPHFLHSEIICITKAIKINVDLSECTLYIYREHKNGILALAKPCKACTAMIKDFGIKKIVFTIENGYSVENYFNENFSKLNKFIETNKSLKVKSKNDASDVSENVSNVSDVSENPETKNSNPHKKRKAIKRKL